MTNTPLRRKSWILCVELSVTAQAWRECEDGHYDPSHDYDLLAMYCAGGEL